MRKAGKINFTWPTKVDIGNAMLVLSLLVFLSIIFGSLIEPQKTADVRQKSCGKYKTHYHKEVSGVKTISDFEWIFFCWFRNWKSPSAPLKTVIFLSTFNAFNKSNTLTHKFNPIRCVCVCWELNPWLATVDYGFTMKALGVSTKSG